MRVSHSIPGKARKLKPSVDLRDVKELRARLEKLKKWRSCKWRQLKFVFRGGPVENQKEGRPYGIFTGDEV